ncbi:O-antigen ligase family protein [Flagellimonas allohymeniacidonis]|uniref:O-antigen ligase domain-containing protein n=1 Tax=Flagellimonas allohymeniacidonis TaxID=2517819 RepID=A0A4Q8QDD1_9FLAO|nr:O-antigen ligase family protein [Allomuricauda hymeniacidonis]TAI47537.1 O-antigen ligase domain-containing protein [Allomuricauda hymeniacidonis]
MKSERLQHKRILVHLNDILMLAFAALLPLNLKLLPLLLAALLGIALLRIQKETILQNLKLFIPYFIGFVLLFVWQAISLIWTTEVSFGVDKLGRRAFYIVAPALFVLTNRIEFIKPVKAYIVSNIILCLAGFVHLVIFFITEKMHFIERTLQEGVNSETASYLIFHGRNNFIFLDIHRTYFCFSLIICILVLFFSKKSYFGTHIKYLALGLISFVIFLLQAKITVIILVILLVTIFLVEVRKKPVKVKFWASIVFGSVLLLGFHVSSPRFNRMINEISNISENTNGSFIERINYTNTAIALIKEAPIIGHGFGDVRTVMKQKMEHLNYADKLEQPSYDPHNEFLKALVGTGLIGFLLLTMALITPLFFSIKEKNLAMGILIGTISILCLVEPLLSRQMGMFTSLFFIGIFVKSELVNE